MSPLTFFTPLQILLLSLLDAQHQGRKPQVKYRATLSIGSILGPDTPPMSFNESPADSQTQTNSVAASFVTTLNLIKAVKDTFDELWGNARTVISYMQGKPSVVFSSAHAHRWLKSQSGHPDLHIVGRSL